MNTQRCTQKEETFCVKYFELGHATKAAIAAGYSPNFIKTNTTKILNRVHVQARLKELRGKTESDAVMSVTERKEQLTKVARNDLDDTAIRAMDILNKMDKIYTEGVQITVNNAQVAVAYREFLKAQEEYGKLTENVTGDIIENDV